VTAPYCIIKRDTNIIIFSNAGHQPLLIYRPKNYEFFELNASGLSLGLSKKIELKEKEMSLIKGDRVLLYTDGIIEYTDPDRKEFGDNRFKDFIRSNSTLPSGNFTETLLSTLQASSCENTFNDDLCLLVFDVM
jgi:phosphoserine phosphatase RsbU/P